MPDTVLLVRGAPVDPARLARVLYGPLTDPTVVLAVAADGDPLRAIENALRLFAPSRIVLAGPDPRLDLTGAVEDRFGGPVLVVAAGPGSAGLR